MLIRIEGKIDLLNERDERNANDIRDLRDRAHMHSNRIQKLEAIANHVRDGEKQGVDKMLRAVYALASVLRIGGSAAAIVKMLIWGFTNGRTDPGACSARDSRIRRLSPEPFAFNAATQEPCALVATGELVRVVRDRLRYSVERRADRGDLRVLAAVASAVQGRLVRRARVHGRFVFAAIAAKA
jgi:hypothetical protein